MKFLILLLIGLFLTSKIIGQKDKVDSLIVLLNNNSIIASGSYIGPNTILAGKTASDLIDLGKLSTRKLVSVLDDSTKGVIAHYILTIIWKLPIASEIMIYNEKLATYTVTWNDLNYFIDAKNKNVYANFSELKTNKIMWEFFLKDKIN